MLIKRDMLNVWICVRAVRRIGRGISDHFAVLYMYMKKEGGECGWKRVRKSKEQREEYQNSRE